MIDGGGDQGGSTSRHERRSLPHRIIRLAAVMMVLGLALELTGRIAESVPRVRERLDLVRRADVLASQTEQIKQLQSGSNGRILALDPVLGWRYQPGGTGTDTITVNVQGHRGPRTVDSLPPDGTVRVAVWGDSFVFCNEASDSDCWVSRVAEMSPGVETLNFGVGGFGTDQALLRFQVEGLRFRPAVVVLGFTEDDLRRLVSVSRRFLSSTEPPLFKPRFRRREDGSVEFVPSPTMEPDLYERLLQHPLGIRDRRLRDDNYEWHKYATALQDVSAAWRLVGSVWFRTYRRYLSSNRLWTASGVFRPDSEAFALQLWVFERFVTIARERGQTPVLLLLPGRARVEGMRNGEPSMIQPLLDSLRSRRLPFVDAVPALIAAAERDGVASLFAPGSHYSAQGNSVIGRWIADDLVPTWRQRERD